jgi:putative redox protein
MAHKTATVTLVGDGLKFIAKTGSGHTLTIASGPGNHGPTPAELLPVALAGCTAMDVISILRKKRQEVRHYEVDAKGTQMEAHPNAFTRIDLVHIVEGPAVDVEAVRRAIELSATRYCSVGSTLSSGMTEVHHGYVVRDHDAGTEVAGEALVTGPFHEVAEAVAVG